MIRKLVAIHQPNFFPWLGYFDKLARADVFILMDNVQFSKKGGTWSNRVKMIVNGEATWITVPVVRSYHGNRNINEMEIDNTIEWRGKISKMMLTNYGKATFFREIYPLFSGLLNIPTANLARYNKVAIYSLAEIIGLDTSKIVIGSTLEVEGKATDLLINMIKAVGGNAYLAGGGANGYQEDEKFATGGVELIYQNYNHPIYHQCNTPSFIFGLSIIDALMNVGFEGIKELLNKCVKKC